MSGYSSIEGAIRQSSNLPILKGTQIQDKELMDTALEEFKEKASAKFLAGIQEHNSNGDKGMCNMTFNQRVKSCKEEVMDLWFYLCSLEQLSQGVESEDVSEQSEA